MELLLTVTGSKEDALFDVYRLLQALRIYDRCFKPFVSESMNMKQCLEEC